MLLVTPNYVARVGSFSAAAARAARVEAHAKAAHGPQAGADCYVVAEGPDGLHYRGMVAGRRLIGRDFGCASAVEARAQTALDGGHVR